eukprot:CAMPEP_0204866750 /NCGR_PEP_ID=MMETSP1348-20121228/18864_1 /ASSEMBLY_ACC=CAM_ASM_000700 /TAXON_ID=215587 /ORGANISM="Aplanochytrium stocchinoi, Strain GSBS06" /LENGTH=50 /DNA_ID=CAMNT_0052018783 /DNA_START=1050 /DNA_END=1202 /DNA_ORIENTATION=-
MTNEVGATDLDNYSVHIHPYSTARTYDSDNAYLSTEKKIVLFPSGAFSIG